ncbi:MAG: GWxTD domain-containing protein [Candidatus Aminicenantes bacterium]|nr:GWxTD domain-containing protein [Candidatus Aminicenantes bacterium]
MKNNATILALMILLLMPLSAAKEKRAKLPEKYKKWIEEEVVYIITPKEKDVFLQLENDREREIFIEAFWKQRDPTSGSPQNEFKDEHYRRLGYANEFFGRGTPKPGWMTDQGRVYIVLGPPKSIEYFENVMNVYPTQIWFYHGDPNLGLPTSFNIIFFKEYGTGEYILYSPSDHGPQSLIADFDYQKNFRDIKEAYNALEELEPNLAHQTLSLIPGERGVPGLVSLASDTLFSAVFSSPQKKVEDKYATAILKYKDWVEVEYTANYIGSDHLVKVMKDDSGLFLVHYAVEPQKLSVDLYQGRYSAHFELNGRVTDTSGKTIFQYSKEFPLNMDREQLEEIQSKSFSLQDMFPLAPGNYKFDVLIKNRVSKEFASLEKDIAIPQEISEPRMSALILSYQAKRSEDAGQEIIPFKIGDSQLLCQSRRVFNAKDTLFIFFQVLGLGQESKSQGTIKLSFFKDRKELFSRTKTISEYQTDMNFVEAQSLANFSPGFYTARVSVLDKEGNELLFETDRFEISSVVDLPRPLVISKVMPVSRLEEYTYTLGIQYLNKGNITEASSLLERAYHQNPSQLKYGLGYAQVLFINREYQKVGEVLAPFLDSEEESEGVLYFLGKSTHALGLYQEALSFYERYLSHFGANLEILNLVGSCHYQLGDKKEALEIWQRSLELNPDQEDIKKLVQSLHEKSK